jgi:salicylate hydroxylase
LSAGIAGLAAATALRHHNVTVLEQSRLKEEIGAAIHLAPNAAKIALKWGLDLDKLGSPDANWVRKVLCAMPYDVDPSCLLAVPRNGCRRQDAL